MVPALFLAGQFHGLKAYLVENGVTFFIPDGEDETRVDMIAGQVWIRDSTGHEYNAEAIRKILVDKRLSVFSV